MDPLDFVVSPSLIRSDSIYDTMVPYYSMAPYALCPIPMAINPVPNSPTIYKGGSLVFARRGPLLFIRARRPYAHPSTWVATTFGYATGSGPIDSKGNRDTSLCDWWIGCCLLPCKKLCRRPTSILGYRHSI